MQSNFLIPLFTCLLLVPGVELLYTTYPKTRRSLLFEANPADLLPDGTPAHWSFTRNGTLKWMIIRVDFPDGAHPSIPISGSLNDSLISTSLFFSDSSWGKVNFSYTFPPNVNVTTIAASSTSDTMKKEAITALEKLGYVYCGGPCGTSKAQKQGQYDAVVLAFMPSPPVVNWAGLGVVGNGFTWTVYPTSPAVLEHEIGHNFGMQHGITAKSRVDDLPYNTPTYEGFSRMAGGGLVSYGDESSRYNNNGHFGPASKHWFGWIEDSNVVFMHPNGSTSAYPRCQDSFMGKINAFDRPDVIPGQTANSSGSPYFAVKIAYTAIDLIYVYYRTSYAETRAGVSVQYCKRSFASSSNAGMNSLCYTYDVAGDTATMLDSTILPGTTYVVAPPPAAIERIGLYGVMGVLPVITVDSVPSFADCPNMMCPPGKDISASVNIRFLNREDLQRVPTPALVIAPSATKEYQLTVDQGRALISAVDRVQGAGGRANLDLALCPSPAISEATVYLYDSPPLSTLLFSAPPSYQAVNRFKAFSIDCCTAGDEIPVSGVRAVVIRQMDVQPLHIAELEVYATGSSINIAPQATCWSLPVGGSYYNGDLNTGLQTYLTDGLTSTFSHSGDLGDGESGRGHYDMCVFDSPLPIQKIKVTPRANWASRSKNLRVETYAFVGSDPANPSGLRPIGLLWNQTISMTGSVWSQTLRLPAFPASIPCQGRKPPVFSFPAVQGAAYALIQASNSGDVRLRASFNVTKCPGSAYIASPGAGARTCTPCPTRALAFGGNMAACPVVAGQTCTAVIAKGKYSGPYDPSRDFVDRNAVFGVSKTVQEGLPRYMSPTNASIGWNSSMGQWEIRHSNGTRVASRQSSEIGSFTARESGWDNASSTQHSAGIKAVVIEQAQLQHLNLCEIEMYDASGANLASARAKCYNLPVSTGYYYTSDRKTGYEPRLNDGCTGGQDVCSCSHTGEAVPGNFVACVLDSPMPVDAIKVYINPVWASRSTKLNLKLYTSLPEGPLTVASFANPAASKQFINMAQADSRYFTMCYLSVDASEPAILSNNSTAP